MEKVSIIAEIAQGYEGDAKLCERFVKIAKQCGADAVKFQIFEADELCLPNYKHFTLFKSLYIPKTNWKSIIELCNKIGIDFYADIFGAKTLNWILKHNIAGIKIHSTDLKNYNFISKVKNKNIKVILGAGGSTLDEIKKAIDYLGNNEIIVMSGFQAEPNLIHDVELNKINIIKNTFNIKVGYTDHIEVVNPLCMSLPAMAVLMGAHVIEKHLTIERDALQLEDYISALNPSEFTTMVKMIRDVELFPDPQSKVFNLTDRELQYRKNSKKVILAARHLKVGTCIRLKDLTMLRTNEHHDELLDIDNIINKTVKVKIKKHHIIRKEFLK